MEKGCSHYHSDLDIVAIRFKCCGQFYPCYFCHEELAGHPAERWPSSHFQVKAILCRKCQKELSIWEYLECVSKCLFCQAPFNPGCRHHWPLYFETEYPNGERKREF